MIEYRGKFYIASDEAEEPVRIGPNKTLSSTVVYLSATAFLLTLVVLLELMVG